MTGSSPLSTEQIVDRIAQLRAKIMALRGRSRESGWVLHHAIDPAEMRDEQDYQARLEQKIAQHHRDILELANLVSEPHPLWPGGWLLEAVEADGERRWRAPSIPPYEGQPYELAWSTREDAEAFAVRCHARDFRPREYRAVWSPVRRGVRFGYDNEIPLDAASLDLAAAGHSTSRGRP